jgi:hypothetical protein
MLLKFSFFGSLPTLRSYMRMPKCAAMRSRKSAHPRVKPRGQRTTPSVLRSGPSSTHCAPSLRWASAPDTAGAQAGAGPRAPPNHPRWSEYPPPAIPTGCASGNLCLASSSRAASAGPCHRPARPTAAKDYPAPWQWPSFDGLGSHRVCLASTARRRRPQLRILGS